MSKSIEDVMICPNCGSENCYCYSVDELDFSYGKGYHATDCHCKECSKDFRLCFEFKYNITKSWVR